MPAVSTITVRALAVSQCRTAEGHSKGQPQSRGWEGEGTEVMFAFTEPTKNPGVGLIQGTFLESLMLTLEM